MAVKLNTLADVTVTTAGTRVQISTADTPITSIILQAKTANSGVIIVGDSAVAAGVGIELAPGASITITADLSGRQGGEEMILSDFWADSATNGNKVKVAYVKRR